MSTGTRPPADCSTVVIAVLGGLVVLLAGAGFLVRRKEREPSE